MKMFNGGKTRMIGLQYGEKNYDDMFPAVLDSGVVGVGSLALTL